MTTTYQPGDRVHCSCGCGAWVRYRLLEWHEQANNGCDIAGHRVSAAIDGERLRVQHGENPEAVRWYSLDELNDVGGVLCDTAAWSGGNPLVWCDDIDRQMGAARA